VTGIDAQDLYEIVGTLPNGCSATSYALTTQVGSWFGWPVTTSFDCARGINPNETESTDPGDFYRPVAFAFFKNTSMYSMVFCYSTLVEHDIVARLGFSAQNNGVFRVFDKGVVTSLGFGPNGLNFPNPYNSSRVTGVGDSVKYTLSDAVIQYAGFQGIGAGISTSRQDEILGNSTLTAEYAQTAYLYYQAFVAQSTFVVGTIFQQPATYDVPTYRLVANKPVSHALTVLCGITGVSLLAIFLYHHMGRGDVWLGAEPSGIATVAALLSRSRFPAHVRLHPSDSIEEIQAKLGGLRFKMLPTGGVDMAESDEKA